VHMVVVEMELEEAEISNFRFEMALLTTLKKNQEKPDQGFRRTGAEVARTAPPRPIFARASVHGRENRAARFSG